MFFRRKPYGLWSDQARGWLCDESGKVIELWSVDAAVEQLGGMRDQYPDVRAMKMY